MAQLREVARAARIHQWAKNLLVFVPLVSAHLLLDLSALLTAFWAFIAFSFTASSVYLVNDLVDIEHDRLHPTKRFRPLASGRLKPTNAQIAAICLLIVAIAIAFIKLSVGFWLALAVYLMLTTSYSLYLKRIIIADVLILAGLYTLRIFAGAVAIGVVPSFWLLAFSTFIFLSLAMIKRCTELQKSESQSKSDVLPGRGYRASDLNILSTFGVASGYIAVLVLALYINDPATAEIYAQPMLIWAACPVLLGWISYVWLLAGRSEIDDDPVVFAIKNPVSLSIGFVFIGIFAGAAI